MHESDVEERHILRQVPILILMPHSRCNCRCVMCDIWKANQRGITLDLKTVARLKPDLQALGVRSIALSGGEALMHANLWALCAVLKELPVTITLLSTGLILARHAVAVTKWCDDVIVSLDGPQPVHDAIRGVPRAYERLAQGVAALRQVRSGFPVTGRCVVQKRNFRVLGDTIEAARAIGLDRISFLAADVSSGAFNHPDGWQSNHAQDVCLDDRESEEFSGEIARLIARNAEDFASGFVAEAPDKFRRLGRYFRAMHGKEAFPEVRCNAPWVSAVIEADGTVRPCFFHDPIGKISEQGLAKVLNSEPARAFRRNLDVHTNPICQRCVCTLNL